jgi:cytochrome b
MLDEQNKGTIRVWDPMIRIGHWVLVAAFATAYLSEGEPEWLHAYASYIIAVIVTLRVIWGFDGPRRARFSNFVISPSRVMTYLRDLATRKAERHIGHSPAGGAMILALLFSLSVTTISGLGTLAIEEGRGPLAGILSTDYQRLDDDDGSETGEAWEEVHEVAANATLLLVILHIGGVLWASFAHRENLVRAMITGRKRVDPT